MEFFSKCGVGWWWQNHSEGILTVQGWYTTIPSWKVWKKDFQERDVDAKRYWKVNEPNAKALSQLRRVLPLFVTSKFQEFDDRSSQIPTGLRSQSNAVPSLQCILVLTGMFYMRVLSVIYLYAKNTEALWSLFHVFGGSTSPLQVCFHRKMPTCFLWWSRFGCRRLWQLRIN